MRLYHCGGSRGLRALWTIEEIGLECELRELRFPPRRLVPGYLDLNPVGTVPTLVDGAVVMTESSAIAQYLATRYAPDTLAVQPDEPDYGPYLDFLHHADATLTFPQTVYLRYAVLEPHLGLQRAGELYADWFAKRQAKVARRLETRRFLCADRFTVADIAVAYAILLARKIGLVDRVAPPLNAWFDSLAERPAYARAIARDEAGVPLAPGTPVP
ncbi:glutathione S-transferase family protein [Sphingomonas solaris]|uniref:Glutathione S-transferase family protein n=1 Tax=Alterirhizorhabdus solaris TaxID=2529389 RepID=A0A558RD15_9SPHN|nr:glutathione S-transferase family protein [Sphingomonas solaris]TVV77266.1 glutathione S-transferase family protein [Sphingomonas solaris]